MLNFLGFLLFGLIVGAIARFLVPGPQPMGLLKTMGLGCIGSIAGGTIASLLFRGDLDISTAGWIGSILGAVGVLLVGLRLGRRSRV